MNTGKLESEALNNKSLIIINYKCQLARSFLCGTNKYSNLTSKNALYHIHKDTTTTSSKSLTAMTKISSARFFHKATKIKFLKLTCKAEQSVALSCFSARIHVQFLV